MTYLLEFPLEAVHVQAIVQDMDSKERQADMESQVACSCGRRLYVDSDREGHSVECPSCHALVDIPIVVPAVGSSGTTPRRRLLNWRLWLSVFLAITFLVCYPAIEPKSRGSTLVGIHY